MDASVLVARAQAGDEGAWHALVGRHLGLVHAVCRGYGLPDRAAAEVNQLVWLRLVEHLPRIRTPDALGGWIAAISRSLCLAPERSADRSGYVVASVGRTATNGNGAGPSAGRRPTSGRGPRAERAVSGPPPTGSAAAGPASAGPAPAAAAVGESGRLAMAFTRIGARCQRLLRLAATRPRPSAEVISAALDLALADVEPACVDCVDRLRHLAASEAPDVLAELQRTIVAGDAVPEGWWDAARSAYDWHMLDAAPAERVYDSTTSVGLGATTARALLGAGSGPGSGSGPCARSIGAVAGAGPAGAPAIRRMRFSAASDGVELAVDTNGDEVLLVGQVASGGAVAITARWPGGERTARTDEAGAFRFHGLPAAPLCVQVEGDHPLKTGWILP